MKRKVVHAPKASFEAKHAKDRWAVREGDRIKMSKVDVVGETTCTLVKMAKGKVKAPVHSL